jgi:asparagine synthase (glutamine-hydrolyzing)
MCGIAGFFSKKSNGEATDILERMLSRIKYRGPDESGIYLSPDAGLGSVRLSIIDLQTGQMPLSNQDDSLWIVYNGEIFNYIELKEKLIQTGHLFKTSGDTEVILHLYEEYGADCLNMMNGQFAFAIWNSKKRELFLARDRVGIRPLFYTSTADGFVFASETKALFEYPGVKPQISITSLSQVFTFWTTLTPHTLFENVYEVSPGHCLTINTNGIRHHTYWELPVYEPGEYSNASLDHCMEQFEELFTDAVRLRMRSDVPVGAYLSGGIDSCATTSYIKKISGDNLRTFSIGFTDKEFDESSYQELAVDYFKTNHNRINCSQDDIAEKFPEVVWHAETALLRTAPVPMYVLSGLVNSHNIKVVITGEGADELLGGYNIFKEAAIRQFWAKDPKSAYRPLLLRKLYPYLPQMHSLNGVGLKLFFGYKLGETDSPVYSHLLRWHNTSRIQNYFSKETRAGLSDYNPVGEFVERYGEKLENADLLSRAQWIETKLFMSGYLLSSQGDRMAMAHSLEGRYPFLDHRIIDFCMKLPPDYKMHGLNEKYLLKRMMSGKLPQQIVERAKQPYRAPISKCFISENSPGYVENMFSEESISSAGFFDFDKVMMLIDKLKAGTQVSEIDHMALTGILSTQLLHSFFVEKSTAPLMERDRITLDKIIIH